MCPVAAEVFHEEVKTDTQDMKKQIVALCISVKEPKN
jgi:hypothetical protein